MFSSLLQQAIKLHQSGDLAAAEASYKKLLSIDQRNFDANHLLGVLFYQRSEAQTAFSYLDKARKIAPANGDCRNHLGLVLQKLGKLREARTEFELAIKLKPNSVEAYNNLANLFGKTGHLSESLKLFRKVCQLAPQNALARLNYSTVLFKLDKLEDALQECNEAIRRSTTLAEAYAQRAMILHRLGRFVDAKSDCEKAIALKPNFPEAYCNLSNTLISLRRYDEARIGSEKALALRPHFAEAWINLGSALNGLNRHEDALQSYDKALRLEPNNPVVYHSIGLTLSERNRLNEAVLSYDKSITLKPDYAAAYSDRGTALKKLKRFDEALASYDTAIRLKGSTASFYGSRGSLLIETGNRDAALQDYYQELRIVASSNSSAQQIVADCVKLLSVDTIPAIYSSEDELHTTRSKIEEVLDELASKYREIESLIDKQIEVCRNMAHRLTGFYLAYHQTNDRETMQKLSLIASRLLSVHDHACPPRSGTLNRIRLGIASRKLRNHNGANWAYNWLTQLPKSDYELFTYNFDFEPDELATKFSQLGTHRELKFSPESQDEVISRMRDDRLDFLMLTDVGMNSVSRVLSLHRIAPRQFTAWGHPVTTGSTQMDYYLSSELMEPANAQDHYSEKLVRLPNLALYLEAKDDKELPRKDFGLPEGRVLYGCLQSLFKYLPRYDEVWPRVAERVPNALFVFLEGKPAYMTDVLKKRLKNAFQCHGLDSDKHTVFLPRQRAADYDALLRSMHVSIDSLGWSGGNTSLAAIRYGVPLITLPGTYMRGRHTYAMFKMMGVEELIASSMEHYIQMLIQLGTKADYRHYCSSILDQNRHKLYNDELFAKAFDSFLKENVLG